MKNPELVIAEFEIRRSAERTAYRSKMVGRGLEFIGWWASCAYCSFWLWRKGEATTLLLPIVLGGFIAESLRKRWKLEDRVVDLEHRVREGPIQASETSCWK